MKAKQMSLEKIQIDLLPYSPAHWLAMLESSEKFREQFGLALADGLRDLLVGNASDDWLESLRAARQADPWIHGFGIVNRDHNTVIGNAAFKGPPDHEGIVEIGYGVAPAYEGRGCATQAVLQLVRFASQHNSVRVVRAHTLPTVNASTRVLEKCGFTHVGEVAHFEDQDLVWRWERTLTPSDPALTFNP